MASSAYRPAYSRSISTNRQEFTPCTLRSGKVSFIERSRDLTSNRCPLISAGKLHKYMGKQAHSTIPEPDGLRLNESCSKRDGGYRWCLRTSALLKAISRRRCCIVVCPATHPIVITVIVNMPTQSRAYHVQMQQLPRHCQAPCYSTSITLESF